jgi:hypothetical protein
LTSGKIPKLFKRAKVITILKPGKDGSDSSHFILVVPCAKSNNMLSNRFFQVFLGDKSSRWRKLNNGLPQGSVLAPLLFSLYLSDISSTLSNQFQYSDNIAVTYQHESFSDCKANLKVDLERLNQ